MRVLRASREPNEDADSKSGWVWALWSHVRNRSKRRMRIEECLSLGGKRSLVLIECDGSSYFVGCGAAGVNCILPVPSTASGYAATSSQLDQASAGPVFAAGFVTGDRGLNS
ncbi:MAG TPA: flagellar biosynthetic protein FliO [Acidobacteriaceae bacterium]